MKILITIFVFILIGTISSAEWPHVPFCTGHSPNPNSAACFGYAANKAYDMGSTSDCPATTTYNNDVDDVHFSTVLACTTGSYITNYNLVETGDVILWDSHAVYVANASQRTAATIQIHHKNVGQAPVTSYCYLQDAIDENGRGNPKWIKRRREHVWEITAENDFDGTGGGSIKIETTTGTSPLELTGFDWGDMIDLDAVAHNTTVGEYNRLFDDWVFNGEDLDLEKSTSVRVSWEADDDRIYKARFKKEFDINFYNSFVGVSYNGSMKVKGVTYSDIETANPFEVEEEGSINAEAINQTYNGISYTFDHWNDQSTSRSKTFTPDDNDDYTAYFVGKPVAVSGFTWDCGLYDPLAFKWNKHTNSNVKYRIYRKHRDQYGDWTDPTLICTKNHSDTTYEDEDFMRVSTYIYLVDFDVRAYYTIEQTEAIGNWYNRFGNYMAKPNADELLAEHELPIEFSLYNFPNPFNLETYFVFGVPEAADINIKIYNTRGQLIKIIYEGHKSAGVHTAVWRGENDLGQRVASGIYFMIMQTPEQILKRKLVLLK